MNELKAEGAIKFEVDGVEIYVTEEDLLIMLQLFWIQTFPQNWWKRDLCMR